ncbi:MAG: formate dehydrogenase accessory sulfurtransferase FdhD [Coriobacteriales bacterium]
MRIIDDATYSTAPLPYEALKHLADGSVRAIRDVIQEESLLDVFVDGRHFFRIACLASDLPALVAGRLLTEGAIDEAVDIAEIRIANAIAPETAPNAPLRADVTLAGHAAARIAAASTTAAYEDVPTHGGVSRPPLASRALDDLPPVVPIPWSPEHIFALARVFEADATSHAETFATHTCYLAVGGELLYCCEDLGRHNAFDKVVGRALIDGVDLARTTVFTSGRIPTDMTAKAIRARIPILATKAVPTGQTLALARAHDLTLISSAHTDSIKVFNDPTR